MKKGTPLGMTEVVEMTDSSTQNARQFNSINERETALQTIISDIINQLPTELTPAATQRMSDILGKYSNCLSLNDFDLG